MRKSAWGALQVLVDAQCFSPQELHTAGVAADASRAAGVTLAKLLTAGYTAADMRVADLKDPSALLLTGHTRGHFLC